MLFEQYLVRCDFKKQLPKRHVFKRDWTSCLKHDNHSILYSQHDGEGGGDMHVHPKNEHENLHAENK